MASGSTNKRLDQFLERAAQNPAVLKLVTDELANLLSKETSVHRPSRSYPTRAFSSVDGRELNLVSYVEWQPASVGLQDGARNFRIVHSLLGEASAPKDAERFLRLMSKLPEISKQEYIEIRDLITLVKDAVSDIMPSKASIVGLLDTYGVPLDRLRTYVPLVQDQVRAEFKAAGDLITPKQAGDIVSRICGFLARVLEATDAFNSAATKDERAPDRTHEKWVDRDPAKFPTAESFLQHHYGSRLGMDGDLTLAEIGRYDTPLLTALNREFKGRRHELHVLLPTVTDRANQRLLKKYGYVPQGSDRKSKLAMMSLQRKPHA